MYGTLANVTFYYQQQQAVFHFTGGSVCSDVSPGKIYPEASLKIADHILSHFDHIHPNSVCFSNLLSLFFSCNWVSIHLNFMKNHYLSGISIYLGMSQWSCIEWRWKRKKLPSIKRCIYLEHIFRHFSDSDRTCESSGRNQMYIVVRLLCERYLRIYQFISFFLDNFFFPQAVCSMDYWCVFNDFASLSISLPSL